MRKLIEQKKKEEHYEKEDILDKTSKQIDVSIKKVMDDNTNERIELKRFIIMEKEKPNQIQKIAQKNMELKNKEDKKFISMYLRFKVPFFRNM